MYLYLSYCEHKLIQYIFVIDGQAIAIKLGNQVDRVVASMHRNLAVLNGLADTVTSFDTVKNSLSETYNNIVAVSGVEDDTPTFIVKKAVNLMYLKDRCKKELVLIKNEMATFSSFFLAQIQAIESFFTKDVNSEELKGLRSLALTKKKYYQSELQSLKKMCSGIVEISVPDWKIEKFLLTEPDQSSSYFTPEVDGLLDGATDTFYM